MKSEKEWINNLRNRMEDYSEPLPEGLWDKLSKELEEPKTPKVIPIWRRWQAAAAVLVLLVSSLTYWFWSSPEADFRNQELAVEVKNTPLPAQTSSLDEQVAEVKHAEPFQKEPVALLANVSSKKSAVPFSLTLIKSYFFNNDCIKQKDSADCSFLPTGPILGA